METWRTIWTVFCLVGAVSFAVLLVVIVPMGGIELKRFFRHLSGKDNPEPQTGDTES